MVRIGAVMMVLGMLTIPALAQRFAAADFVEHALTGCHDGVHAIADADVEQQSISFRTGPREVRVFFGSVGVDHAEQGTPGRSYRAEARLKLTCANTLACVWSARGTPSWRRRVPSTASCCCRPSRSATNPWCCTARTLPRPVACTGRCRRSSAPRRLERAPGSRVAVNRGAT
jgi:hypothetical protein